MASTLREKQKLLVKQLLHFNNEAQDNTNFDQFWKVLIYDDVGQDIISPLFSIKELRDEGVTLHMSLHSARERIEDVPAVYFVMPTEENVKRICEDFGADLYESYYINFISYIPRTYLENLAEAAVNTGVSSHVRRVFDQYLNFICVENDLFFLQNRGSDISFYSLNRGCVKDTEMERKILTIADALFSVFVTLDAIPIIRCPRGDSAEAVSRVLDKKLRDNISDKRNCFFSTDGISLGQLSFQRPLLVILDRNFDLASMLHHTWTYQALIHDVLNMKLNRVDLVTTPKGSKTKSIFDLSHSDRFWNSHKGSSFPKVAESIQQELDSYRSSEEEVRRMKSAFGIADDTDDLAISMLSEGTSKLSNAVSSLPQLLETKRFLDMHTNIATALLDSIKARKLDIYFENEEKIMSKQALDKTVKDILSDSFAGTPSDKLRFFLIYYMYSQEMSKSEQEQFCDLLTKCKCEDLSAIQYFRRWRSLRRLINVHENATVATNMFADLMSKASKFAMEGVKNFIVQQHKLPITSLVDSLMENSSNSETDNYMYFDPKFARFSETTSIPKSRTAFSDAVVFVVGGGNYIEYQNLQDYAKDRSGSNNKRILYGCTELLNANDFLSQLSLLGKEIS